MDKHFRTMIVSALRCCSIIWTVMVIASLVSCKQGHIPNKDMPELRNDTGVNIVLTFDPDSANGGFWENPAKPEEKSVEPKKLVGKKAGDPLLFSFKPQHETKVFNGWNTAGGSLPEKVPQVSTVYKAVWRALNQGEAFYTVVHLLENADDAGFTPVASEKRAGVTGSKPTADANIYEGFTYAADISSLPAEIAADGTTKIEFKYKRNEVTLTFDLDGGTTETALTGGNSLTGKWDAKLSLKTPTKQDMAFNGWNTVGGKLPERFPKVSTSYKALWRDSNAPAPSPSPSPAADNLVKNATFAETEAAPSNYSAYWDGGQSPKNWNTWVVNTQGAHDGITFKTADKTFTIATGATALKNGGIQHTITLPDTAAGIKYKLKTKIKAVSGSGAGGAALVKLQTKWLISFTGDDKDFECLITVKEGNKISFKDKDGHDQEVALTGSGNNQIKIELFGSNLKNKTVSFSDISLTKEAAGEQAAPPPSEPPPSQPPTPSPNTETASYTVEHWQENAADSGFTKYDADTEAKNGKVGDAPESTPKTYAGFTYDADSSSIPAKIEASGTVVQLKYKRKQVTLTFKLDGGSTTTPLNPESTLTGKYGAPLTVEVPTKAGHTCTGWKTSGGTIVSALPGTFPPNEETYTAQWEVANLVKNADFAETEAASGAFSAYWDGGPSPVSWMTVAKEPLIQGVSFKAENEIFSITVKDSPLELGILQQSISLPDLKTDSVYRLKIKMEMKKNNDASSYGGAGIVKLYNQELLKKYSGSNSLNCKIVVKSSTELEITIEGGISKTVTIPAEERKRTLQLMVYKLKGYVVSFSNISLIKEE